MGMSDYTGDSGGYDSSTARNMMEGYGVDINQLGGSFGNMTYGGARSGGDLQLAIERDLDNFFNEIEAAENTYSAQPVSSVNKGLLFDAAPTWKDYVKNPFRALDDRSFDSKLSAFTDSLDSLRSPEAKSIYASATPAAQDLYNVASYQQDLGVQDAIVGGLKTSALGSLAGLPPTIGLLTGTSDLFKSVVNRDDYYQDIAEKLGYNQDTIDQALALDRSLRSDSIKNYGGPSYVTNDSHFQQIPVEEITEQPTDSSVTPPIENILNGGDPYHFAINYINQKGLLG